MTPKLRSLLVLLVAVSTGVGIYVVIPRGADVTIGQSDGGGQRIRYRTAVFRGRRCDAGVDDAGPTDCAPVDVGCEVRVSWSVLDALDDGGLDDDPDAGDDAGSDLGWRRHVEVYRPETCIWADAGTWTAGRVRVVQNQCACRGWPDAGVCRVRLSDGGLDPAAWGVTLPDNGFQGLGCVRKVCVEVAGESSWPAECPEVAP